LIKLTSRDATVAVVRGPDTLTARCS